MKSSRRGKVHCSTSRSGGTTPSRELTEPRRDPTNEEYQVGPGKPPRDFQFRPGQSGNPAGRRKKPAIALDLKSSLERALNAKVKLPRGERTKGAAGVEKLVDQFVKGDPRARRDLMDLTKKLGIDLTAGQSDTIVGALAEAISAEDRDLLEDYVRRHRNDHQHGDDQNLIHVLEAETRLSMGLLPKPEEK